ncbi:MAG: chitobiase/beta-hexosaminidase C-terminal domain-containing protein [Bacteroidaceae bacterium]|nr:chitobiase/beta-hexosaminidase C-terminal domain-containing protein [Bacteroidaceae bacterium]
MKQKLLNKLWLRVGVLVAIMTTALAGTVKADSYTYDFSSGGVFNDGTNPTATWTTDYFTILQEQNTSTTKVANYLTAPRWYQNHHVTFTPAENITITQIVINCGGTNNGQTISASTGSVSSSGNNSTWSGTITSASPLVLTMGKQCRPSSIVVTYTPAGGTPTCAAPTFSPAAGTYSSAQSVTISTTTEGATIYYTTNGDDPTTSSSVYSAPITVSETTTVKAIATADGYNNSSVATAVYTITVPSTIAEVRAQGTGSVFTKGVVTSCVGTTGYIQDATAAICVYGSSLTVGDEITVSGTLSTYKGLLEITTPTVTVVSSGNTVNPIVKTIAEIKADDYTSSSSIQGLYVTIENATVTAIDGSNTTIAQGENTIVVRGISSSVEYAVNDVLTLNGNIGCFEAAQIVNPKDVTVQQSTNPVINANATLSLAYDATSGEIAYTIANPVSGVTLAAITTAEWISNITVAADKVTFITTANAGSADREATITLSYTGAEDKAVTVTQGHYVPDYAELPFEFDGGKADIENTAGLTQNGLGGDYGSSPKLKFDGTGDYLVLKFNERPGTLTFDIKGNTFSEGTFTVQTSEDGETYTDLATYTELGATQDEEFDNLGEDVRYIKWIYTEKVNGNVALGNITLAKYTEPVLVPSISVTPASVNVSADGAEGTMTVTYEDITEVVAEVAFCDAEGNAATYDWITAEINKDNNVYYLIDANDGAARTAYFKVWALDDDANEVYSELITITQAAYVAPFTPVTYTLASSITSGKHYIIVGAKDDEYKAMGLQNNNNRAAIGVTVDGSTATVSTAEVFEFVIYGPDASGHYAIYDESANSGYLYAASSSSNHLKTQAKNNVNGEWLITFGEYDEASIVADGSDNRNVMQYNGGSSLFSCYASASQLPVYLYVKDGETTPSESISLNGSGYATYCSQNALDFTNADGFTAWAVTGVEGTTINFSQLTGKAPSGTGMLLMGTAGNTVTVPSATGKDNQPDNLLVGFTEETAVEADLYYGLKGDTFKKVNAGNVPAGKALLPAEVVVAGVKTLTFNFEDDATAIQTIDNGQQTTGNAIYNLAGQRLQKMQKGINIVNGKKVMVK